MEAEECFSAPGRESSSMRRASHHSADDLGAPLPETLRVTESGFTRQLTIGDMQGAIDAEPAQLQAKMEVPETHTAGLTRLRACSTANPGDANPAQAYFRAELDRACKGAWCSNEETHPYSEGSEIKLWGFGKVERLTAFSMALPDELLKLSVAPVLLMRAQLWAAVMFLVLGLFSIVAILENIDTWEDVATTSFSNASDVNRTSLFFCEHVGRTVRYSSEMRHCDMRAHSPQI